MQKAQKSLYSKFLLLGALSVIVMALIVFISFYTFGHYHRLDSYRVLEHELDMIFLETERCIVNSGVKDLAVLSEYERRIDSLVQANGFELNTLGLLKRYKMLVLDNDTYAEAEAIKQKIVDELHLQIEVLRVDVKFYESFVTKVAGVSVLVALFLMIFLGKSLSIPLINLKKAAERIGDGDYSSSVKVESRDELGALGAAFNLMTEKIRSNRRVILDQKDQLMIHADDLEKLNAELEESFDNLAVLSKIGQSIASGMSYEELFERLFTDLRKIIDESYFAIGVYDKSRRVIDYKLVMERGKRLDNMSVSMDESDRLDVNSVLKQKEIIINDMLLMKQAEGKDMLAMKEDSGAVVYMPLIIDDEVLGVACMENKVKDWYKSQRIDIFRTFNMYVTFGLKKSSINEDLQGGGKQKPGKVDSGRR